MSGDTPPTLLVLTVFPPLITQEKRKGRFADGFLNKDRVHGARAPSQNSHQDQENRKMKCRHYMRKTNQMRFPQRPRPGVYQNAFNKGVSSRSPGLKFFQSLKTEDRIIFGIALFVGISALGLILFGGPLWNQANHTLSEPAGVQESMDAFDRYQQEFSQGLKQSMKEMEARHERITRAHDANMKKMNESMDTMHDAFEAAVDRIDGKMDENWKEIEREALKHIQKKDPFFKEYEELAQRRRYRE